ncbi:MAG: hypothetical protein ACREUR_04720, partial [Nitrosospira sp.]
VIFSDMKCYSDPDYFFLSVLVCVRYRFPADTLLVRVLHWLQPDLRRTVYPQGFPLPASHYCN